MRNIAVYLDVDGLERVVKGAPLHSWHFKVVADANTAPAEGAYLLGTWEVVYPSPAECIRPILSKLAKREQEIQAEAFREVQEIKQRREELLSLSYSEQAVREVKESAQ